VVAEVGGRAGEELTLSSSSAESVSAVGDTGAAHAVPRGLILLLAIAVA
jgi:hypothetical protein